MSQQLTSEFARFCSNQADKAMNIVLVLNAVEFFNGFCLTQDALNVREREIVHSLSYRATVQTELRD